ncbi:3-phosphoshikimate 1-carboxyvinyltransferase [Roseibium alexandrii]|uniref:3-phosphoshikimate 1-carboxyvinyltransferase n=1 Tax=Roseibium alexandrii TaxID=388408 RepID=UPI0037518190
MNCDLSLKGLPGDKSISHRALLISSLSARPVLLNGVNLGGAVLPLVKGLMKLGVRIERAGPDALSVCGGLFHSNPATRLYMGPSSAAARLLIGLLAGTGTAAIVDGNAVLRARPMDFVVEPLNSLGADIRYLGEAGRLPVAIEKGAFRGGRARMRVASAQAVSALLLAAFGANRAVEIETVAHARDHTERLLVEMGMEIRRQDRLVIAEPSGKQLPAADALPAVWSIPADPSTLAYPAALAALRGRFGSVSADGVGINPTRIGFFEVLKQVTGAELCVQTEGLVLGEPVGRVVVNGNSVQPEPVSLSGKSLVHSMIDEVPLLVAVMGLTGVGGRLTDCEELVFKETNRLDSTARMLRTFGLDVETSNDGFRLGKFKPVATGRTEPLVVPSFGDHRIAMTTVVVANSLRVPVLVEDGRCYLTSAPGFPALMRQLRVPVKVEGSHLQVGR